MTFRDTAKYGSGLLDLKVLRSSGRLARTDVMDPYTFTITMETDPSSPNYGKRSYWQPRGDIRGLPLRNDRLVHMMLNEDAVNPWPMSLYRPNIVFINALMDCGGDSFEAIKRTGYAPIVARLNLQGMKPSEKDAAVKNFSEKLKKLQSSSNNFVLDKEHDIDLLGRGGGNAKLLPVNDMIEPWLAVCLLNFSIPLGVLLQSGANKSIIESQKEDARIAITDFRNCFKASVEEIVPHITNRDADFVWNKAPLSSPETREQMKVLLEMFKAGAVTREYLLDYFDIDDNGSTFFAPPVDPNQEMALEQAKELAKMKLASNTSSSSK
jgi:hypothetical protein